MASRGLVPLVELMENLFPFPSAPGAAALSSSGLCLHVAPLVWPSLIPMTSVRSIFHSCSWLMCFQRYWSTRVRYLSLADIAYPFLPGDPCMSLCPYMFVIPLRLGPWCLHCYSSSDSILLPSLASACLPPLIDVLDHWGTHWVLLPVAIPHP